MKPYRAWILLFFVALLLRLGMVVYWEYRNPDGFYFGDSDTYWVLGKALAHGDPYVYDGKAIHRMPGYPALIAPLFLCVGQEPPFPLVRLAARLENALIGSLTVLAVAWLAWLLFQNKTLALLAAGIVALDPLNIVMSALILSEAPSCLFMVLQIAFWVKALRYSLIASQGTSGVLFPSLLSGILFAAAVYCRPSWLYFVPFATVVGVLLSPRQYRSVLMTGSIITIVLAFCLLPWWIRNYQMTGQFVATTLQAGPGLYDGLNPKATGGSDMAFVENFRNAEIRLSPKILPTALEYRLNQKMRRAALDWARKHPKQVWRLARTKFYRLWNFWPNEPSFSQWAVRVAVFCSYSPVLALGLCGAVGTWRQGFAVRLLWIPALYITALHIIFVSSIRYRAPAMICFAILAAWIICHIAGQRKIG